MRAVSAALAPLALGMMFLAGAAHAKDTLTLGMVLEPPILDPTAGAAAAISEVTYANIYQGLTRIDEHGAVQPALAKSWTLAPDGLAYSFKLQPGVKFHDGEKFDCSTVQFTYGRAAAKDSVNPQKPIFEPIAGVTCPDPLTAVVALKRPTGGFLFSMGLAAAVMVAPDSVKDDKTHPVGTGPFIFKQWIKGDRVELARNPHYWGAPAKLAGVTFRFIADPSAATTAVMAGDIDAFSLFPAPEALDAIRKDPRFKVVVGTTEGKTILALNNGRKPFSDVRVRRALAYAIDRKALITALGGYGTPIGSHYIPGDPGFVDLTGAYPYDPAKARALLAEAGVKPGTQMVIKLPPPPYARRGGEVIAAMLQQVGINAKLVPVEWAQWLDQVFRHGDFDMTIISHVEPRDLDIYARPKYYFDYHSAAYDALFKRYTEAVDDKLRLDLAGQLQRQLSADEPNVFLFALPKIGVWNAKLHGLWTSNPIFANDVTGVYWAN
ncbi:MAG: ABC transporter substrate-binding protein [Rhodospirillales bacterium]|nr:ABC transporter substrate-binding protein [Rhodospirillales bacterium]